MDFLPQPIEKYVAKHSDPESPLLQKINKETHLHVLKPRMLSGHVQGRVLALLSQMIRPNNILEIGTYTGYATLCLAEGLVEDGKIITIDNNKELAIRTQGYFEESAQRDQIDMQVGNAVDIIPKLAHTWDLVFIDADKENYCRYYDMVIDNMRKGGFIIADNVLWSGKVADRNIQDKATNAIRLFNQKIQEDKRVQNVLFPIRDGLMIVRKC